MRIALSLLGMMASRMIGAIGAIAVLSGFLFDTSHHILWLGIGCIVVALVIGVPSHLGFQNAVDAMSASSKNRFLGGFMVVIGAFFGYLAFIHPGVELDGRVILGFLALISIGAGVLALWPTQPTPQASGG